METKVVELSMFMAIAVAALAVYLGNFLREKFPVLKKYCLPGAVVGGTIFSLISLGLYYSGICELNFDYKTVNKLFYCLFFAASGASASLSLLKKGGKLVIIFTLLAALLAALQNGLALTVGHFLKVDPLISMMTGSIPLTGGHGNAASFAPIAVDAGATAAMEVAIAAATFGLIAGSMFGGPFGNFIVRRHHFEDPALDGQEEAAEAQASKTGATVGTLVDKYNIMQAVFLLCLACGIGQLFIDFIGKWTDFPIHVGCMLGGILIRGYLDLKKGKDHEALYESIDIVGEFSLAIFVAVSISTMKLWQLSGLGIQLVILLFAQLVLVLAFTYFISFNLLGRNYDSAIMAVGHLGFGTGAVPVSMTTMQAVCKKYRFSKLAFFVVPVIGGFISNITNALIITKFLDLAKSLAGLG